jgi:hypothetical protein
MEAEMFVKLVYYWKNKLKLQIFHTINGHREEKYLTSYIEKIVNLNQ